MVADFTARRVSRHIAGESVGVGLSLSAGRSRATSAKNSDR